MNISHSNMIPFGTKLVYLPEDDFFDKIDYKNAELISSSDKISKPTKQACALGLSTCNGGVVQNSEEGTVFHFNKFATHDKLLLGGGLKEAGSWTGLIIGGDRRDHISKEIFSDIRNTFKELGVKVSVLWGQKGLHASSLLYSAEKDTCFFTVARLPRKEIKIKNADDLKGFFEKIFIAKGDELWIDGKEIPREDVNTITSAFEEVA